MTRIAPTPAAPEEGFTIIEVMVAVLVLLVGVLGVLALVENGMSSTRRTSAREQGVNLARDLVERSRQISYTSMTAAGAPAQLRAALPDAGALSGSSFTVVRRNITYTVTVQACSIDDASDGAGYGDTSFCAAPCTTGTTPTGAPCTGPGAPAGAFAASVNVLGVPVTVGGSLLSTVCNAVGSNSSLLAQVSSATSTTVPVSVCAATTSGTVPFDNRPDDLRRVSVVVSWTAPSAPVATVSQATLLTNPLPNNCPVTTPVAPATLPTGCPAPIS